jgi:hypothetical protein
MAMHGWQVTISGLKANGYASVHEYTVWAGSAKQAIERASFLAREEREWPDVVNDIFAEELDCDGVDWEPFGPDA